MTPRADLLARLDGLRAELDVLRADADDVIVVGLLRAARRHLDTIVSYLEDLPEEEP